MSVIVVKYAHKDPRTGNLNYRRRVPKVLQSQFPSQTMLVKALGKGGAAMVAYGKYHEHIERLIVLAKNGVTGLSPREERDSLRAQLEQWGADPTSSGRSEEELTWRGEAADKLLAPYQDPLTGMYRGVPSDVSLEAGALLSGLPKTPPAPTIRDAFKFYLEERPQSTPEKQKKHEQRLRRAEGDLIAAVGADKTVSELTRADARRWRDMRIAAKVSPNTILREKNTLSAVINYARRELDAKGDNPFEGLPIQKADTSRRDERKPLPLEVISGVYDALGRANPDLLGIWTILDFTGARPSEIRELLVGEFMLDDPVPHIIIQEREGRTLKNSWSTRKVPLVGGALEVARKVVSRSGGPAAPAFPRYCREGGMDSLSQSLSKRIRKLTQDPKHSPYSLRHNMKDRLNAAEVFEPTQNAIMGHAGGNGEAKNYGGPKPLRQMQEALEKVFEEYRA